MIVSHHGEYEYGSSKLPMTLEAVALHHLDNLDAKLASFTQLMRTARTSTARGRSTSRQPRAEAVQGRRSSGMTQMIEPSMTNDGASNERSTRNRIRCVMTSEPPTIH